MAHTGSYLWKGSVSYVTGTHSLKVGYQQTLMTDDRTWMTNNQSLTYRVDNGVPNQLTQSISPWVNDARAGWQACVRARAMDAAPADAAGRLAVRSGVGAGFRRSSEGPSRFLPTPIVVPETRGIDSYKDITPRFGVAYDVAGRGRTAIKMSLGKYLEGVGVSGIYAITNPTLRMPQTTPVFGTAGRDAGMDRRQRQLRAGLRSAEPGRTGSPRERRRFLRCAVECELWQERADQRLRSERSSTGWGVRPSDWNLALRSSSRSAGGLRWM